MAEVEHPAEERVLCPGCGQEIDPETCGCGQPVEGHGYAPGHGPIPMGCDCARETVIEEPFEEYEERQLRYGRLPQP